MKATLEPVAWKLRFRVWRLKFVPVPFVWVLRIHNDPQAVLGDAYFASMTVVADKKRCGKLLGFAPASVNKEAMSATFRAMREAGMTHCMWARAEDDGFRTVKRDLATQKMTVLR